MREVEVSSLDEVASLVKRCLTDGRRVEIERLGVFRRRGDGSVRFDADRRPKVFLAYAEEDGERAEALYSAFALAGFDPWMDRRKLLPGQNWPRAIEGAIETADFFVACLSKRSVVKRSVFQSELRYALDCARNSPFGDIYFIPARLEECSVPSRIRAHVQYVDLFPDFDAGAQRIVATIQGEMQRREKR